MFRNLKFPLACALFSTCLIAAAWADSLELQNGSLIKGTYLGGTGTVINFRVGSTVQHYAIADVASIAFDSATRASNQVTDPELMQRSTPVQAAPAVRDGTSTTVPSGTHLSVRMVDSVDSDRNQVGDKFHAALDQPLIVNDVTVAPKGADVYGQLTEAKGAGHISGRSELKLELTSLMVNGQSIPLTTGEYSLTGSSRGKNTAEKVGGGAAIGALIGAIAGGGKGAAIGAGVGAGAGTAVQVMTHGQQVHVPSETLLDFVLQQDVRVPTVAN
jgi:hypothetical protein